MAKAAKPITRYRLTDYARLEMARRQISVAAVDGFLFAPEQTACVGKTAPLSRQALGREDTHSVRI
jgi:hypothetical protein